MNKNECLEQFLDDVIVKFKSIIKDKSKDNLHIKMDVIVEKFYRLFPTMIFDNKGLFLRSIKSIIKRKGCINWNTKRTRSSTDHFIILQSDRIYINSDNSHNVISDINDPKIIFIADMYAKKQEHVNLIHSQTAPSKQSTIPASSSPYPLLHSLGIDLNFESNKDQLVNLISELVHLFKSNNEPLKFIHRGNDRSGLLVAVPKAKTYATFDKMERTQNWLAQILDFVNNKNTEDDTFYWILKHIYKKSPHVVVKIASEAGHIICSKMSAVEASAMWVEANISIRAARVILRHLHVKFGKRLQVPFDQITMLSHISKQIQPEFGDFKYQKEGNVNKVPETIKYWTIKPKDLLELDFSRLLTSEKREATFGYKSKIFQPHELGVVVILGSDHGGGRSRYLVRTNYEPSSFRRANNKVGAGTRTLQFAEVICKKDVFQIQAKIAPLVNETIKTLENSKLIAVKIDNHVSCKFLPSNAENITTTIVGNNAFKLNYSIPSSLSIGTDNIVTTIVKTHHPIDMRQDPNVHIWTVIPRIKIVIAGDLSFFATSTGRDGHSSCRCVYCDSSYNQWNDPSSISPTIMTLSRLHQLADQHRLSTTKIDTKGVIMKPLLEIDPSFYIVPLLHLQIGIVNKLWSSLLHFLDEFVEQVSEFEATLKINIETTKENIQTINDNIEILTVNRLLACEEYAKTLCIDIKASMVSLRNDISKQKQMKSKNNKELRTLKRQLVEERSKRSGDITGLDNLLYNILDQKKIKKQHFHGGAMNGVCCRRLLDNVKEIFNEIKKVVSDKVSQQQSKNDLEIERITLVINDFYHLFETADIVFFQLRILDPTLEEIESIKKSVSVFEKLWKNIDLKQGPKLHILFDHVIEQVELFKGISDLVEDFIEQYHQTGKMLDHLVARMSTQCFRQQELVKIRRQWLSNNPHIENQIDVVNQIRMRKSSNLPSIQKRKVTKHQMNGELKKIKREMVQKNPYFEET